MNIPKWLDREEKLIGKEAVEKLICSHVMVIGCGGVGGYVCETLARSGVGCLTIIDHDTIDVTNINRQIIALTSNIGLSKTEVTKNRLLDINSEIKINAVQQFVTNENIDELITKYKPNFICECIDCVPSKVAIIESAKKNDVEIISCMGTGYKLDSGRLKISDISRTNYCPLAKKIRHELKERGIANVPVLWSDEEKAVNCSEVATISFLPSIAGIKIAEYTIKRILNC